jgi:putative hydrolase of the HAD superfamily
MRAIAFDLQGTLVDHTRPPTLFPEVKKCLTRLKKTMILVVVTEGKELNGVEEMLQQFEIRGYFHMVLHLKGTSLRKSDGSAFQRIVELLSISPQDLMVVGDVPQSDIRGGKKVGAITVRIRRGKFEALEPSGKEEVSDFEIRNLKELETVVFGILL